jgi:ubiquinone/menaquinone biosynthesis C-methylase UbiE
VEAEKLETEKLLKEYTALAPGYDRRWSAYLRASLAMTKELIADLPAGRVLDVACGTGQLLEILMSHPDQPELFGVDRVQAMLAIAKQRIGQRGTLLEAAAEALPFESDSFELVTSTNALHYFQDAPSALCEMRRVLAPNGNLIITDWCRDYTTMKLLNHMLPWTRHAHVHTFGLRELEHDLAKAGFAVTSRSKKKIDWFWGLMSIRAVAA